RRGADAPGAAELRAELVARGVRVTLAACDVADREALAGLLERLRADGDRPRSVFHAAGLVDATRIAELDPTTLAELFAAKAAGATHLHQLLDGDHPDGEEGLDAFVLFSSVAAAWGSGGQAGYGAANAFLDGLAQRRRALGRPATSV